MKSAALWRIGCVAWLAIVCGVLTNAQQRSDGRHEDPNEVFDKEFAEIRRELLINGLDPMDLPSDEDTFSLTLFNKTVDGSVWIGNGKLSGLASIHRSGDMTLQEEKPTEYVVAGSAGLTGTQVSYSIEEKLGNITKEFDIEYIVPFISLYFKTDVFITRRNVTLEECNIQEFSYSNLELKHFGVIDDFLYQMVVNTVLQVVNDNVKDKLQDVLCELLEKALHGGNFYLAM